MVNSKTFVGRLCRWWTGIAVVGLTLWSSAARAQINYAATVLYPLTAPSGFTSGVPGSSVAGQTVGSGDTTGSAYPQALLWSGPSGSVTNLNPAGFVGSEIDGTTGSEQVGYGDVVTNMQGSYVQHAVLWSGTAASAVDLQPTGGPWAGFNSSVARAGSGNQQVGDVTAIPGGTSHAVLWNGAPSSAVDLNPANVSYSEAFGTDGAQQVGWAGNGTLDAYLWSGTAASAIDLGPAGFLESRAVGVSGGQEVGYGFGPTTTQGGVSYNHAFLWTGTESSAVDLDPAGYVNSEALATNGSVQVGNAFVSLNAPGDNDDIAFAWSGSAASAVDLQSLLPANYDWVTSTAYSIDAAGNIYGTAGGTFDGVTGAFAVEWSPVPEPGMTGVLVVGACGLLMRRKRTAISEHKSAFPGSSLPVSLALNVGLFLPIREICILRPAGYDSSPTRFEVSDVFGP
ncbi:MAG: hypothetical protein ABSH22_20250 [Tepidisphaeraceae bacterium]